MTSESKRAWAHLPNARHIDAVLEDFRARPNRWILAADEARADNAVTSALWLIEANPQRKAAQDNAFHETQSALELEEWLPARQMKWAAVTFTTDALIAWDDSAALLECPPDVLRAMIDLAEPPVCHQAALLLPYAIVRSNDK